MLTFDKERNQLTPVKRALRDDYANTYKRSLYVLANSLPAKCHHLLVLGPCLVGSLTGAVAS